MSHIQKEVEVVRGLYWPLRAFRSREAKIVHDGIHFKNQFRHLQMKRCPIMGEGRWRVDYFGLREPFEAEKPK